MIGFIGGGNMASALVRGITQKGMRDVIVSEPSQEKRDALTRDFGVKTTVDNREVVRISRIVILAVKPQIFEDVLAGIAGDITDDKTVVSIAAGITLAYLTAKLKTKKIVRVMPNVGAFAGESMSVMSLCECFPDKDINIVKEIFMASGRVMFMPERHMNAVTALSGSGPAFIALFIKSMVDAATGMGLGAEEALELARQTATGTARLLDEGISPQKLMEMVTSPGGTTAAGLKEFEASGLGEIVKTALEAASKRAGELAR